MIITLPSYTHTHTHALAHTHARTRTHTHTPMQLIEWFEEYAEEFFQTHTELGESLDVAETLMAELNQFECSTQVRS